MGDRVWRAAHVGQAATAAISAAHQTAGPAGAQLGCMPWAMCFLPGARSLSLAWPQPSPAGAYQRMSRARFPAARWSVAPEGCSDVSCRPWWPHTCTHAHPGWATLGTHGWPIGCCLARAWAHRMCSWRQGGGEKFGLAPTGMARDAYVAPCRDGCAGMPAAAPPSDEQAHKGQSVPPLRFSAANGSCCSSDPTPGTTAGVCKCTPVRESRTAVM